MNTYGSILACKKVIENDELSVVIPKRCCLGLHALHTALVILNLYK